WASSNTSVAIVSGSGLVSGVSVGGATITATSEGQSGAARITMLVPVASPVVSPATAGVGAGQRRLVGATLKGRWGDGVGGRWCGRGGAGAGGDGGGEAELHGVGARGRDGVRVRVGGVSGDAERGRGVGRAVEPGQGDDDGDGGGGGACAKDRGDSGDGEC